MPTFIFRWIPDRQSQVFLFSLNILLNILLLSKMWRPFYVDLKTLFSSIFKLKRIVFPHSTFDYLYIYVQLFALTNKEYHHKSSGCVLLCCNFKCVTFQRCVRGTTKLVSLACVLQHSGSACFSIRSCSAAPDPEWLPDPQSNIHISSVVCVKAWRYKVMYF